MYHTWILWDIEASIPHLFRLLPTWRNMEVRMATRKRCVMASPRMLKQPCLNARGWTKNCSETWGETSRTRGWNMKNIYIYTVYRFWMVLTCFERRRGVWPNKNELMGTFSQEILWVFILQTYWFKPLTFPVHISLNHRKTLVALVLTQTWCRVGTRWERIEANSWKINCWIGWIVWNVLSLTKSTLW